MMTQVSDIFISAKSPCFRLTPKGWEAEQRLTGVKQECKTFIGQIWWISKGGLAFLLMEWMS
jgi:hypothetical protein